MNRRSFLVLGSLARPVTAGRRTGPTANGVGAVQPGRKNIPNVMVTSQDGRRYRFYDDLVKGKMVIINFFYAQCTGICPRMTSNLLKVRKELENRAPGRVGRDILLYSISLKPEEDTPKHLALYAKMHGIQPGSGWLFLQAKRPDMELLRERLGCKDTDPVLDADIDQHTGMVRLGSDVYDKWAACPALGPVYTIVDSLLWLDLKLPRRGYE